MDAGLKNRNVLVTGASGGIGQEVARSFAAEGANVALHYFRGADRAEELLAQLANSRHLAVGADLRDEADVRQMFEQIESALGPVEVLVANAGFWPPDDVPLAKMSLAQWNETVATDLTSVFLCVREFLQRVEKHAIEAPSIVMIGSTAGHFGEAGHADYAASKSGLMYGLLASLKNEIPRMARRGRINAVCPGWTITPMAREFSASPAAMVRAQQTIPLRKFGQPQDVAAAVVFLSSNKLAGHITGQTLFVSGGMEGRVLYQPDEIDLAK
jgi:NAD(P)-dependent dehydrogenase (short-subunit alcohol dehydrogenase family)